MPTIDTNQINVFVVDPNDNALPGATVRVFDGSEEIGSGTIPDGPRLPVRITLSSAYKAVRLRVEAPGGAVQESTVGAEVGNYTFRFSNIEVAKPAGTAHQMTTGSWVFGSLLLLFLMGFVFWNPATLGGPQAMVVRLLGSVFVALISAFFLGSMNLGAAVRKITIAATGGFAVFCLVFLMWK